MPFRLEFEARVIPGDESTSKLAYEKWEAAGRPEGMSEHFWMEAQKELNTPSYCVIEPDFNEMLRAVDTIGENRAKQEREGMEAHKQSKSK